jgi:hypothetical protein
MTRPVRILSHLGPMPGVSAAAPSAVVIPVPPSGPVDPEVRGDVLLRSTSRAATSSTSRRCVGRWIAGTSRSPRSMCRNRSRCRWTRGEPLDGVVDLEEGY